MSEKRTYVKCELFSGNNSCGSYIADLASGDGPFHEIEELAVGDSMKYTRVEMTEEEFEGLPEFDGF